ncbi:MAG TPA: AbrB/MazE/SpoVT family DNA-binding domain-containing protein [Verrucomicrobiae bacterium]|nr:AbrB/MazE/SpoVT family DNA-binding domain-containing protein [Verrucomicrobiae bacterium]
MKASIIKIGNSKGIRIPKKLLEETRLYNEADIVVEKGALVIRPIKAGNIDEGVMLSYTALAKEWDTPEEDKAWASLQ